MKDIDRFKLLHGPYLPPRVRRGDKLFCEIRGTVTVGGYTGALIPWPRLKKGGNACLILCGALVKAVRHESELAVAHHFGVSPTTVWKWRVALGVEPYSPGTRSLQGRSATAREDGHLQKIQAKSRTVEAIEKRAARRRGKPIMLTPAQKERQRRAVRRSHNKQWREKVSAALKARGHRPPATNDWTAEEDAALLGFDSNAEIALRLGRSLDAVQMRRFALQVPAIVPVNRGLLQLKRQSLAWERSELAKRAGLNTTTVWKLETGRNHGMERHVLARVAAALGCNPEELIRPAATSEGTS